MESRSWANLRPSKQLHTYIRTCIHTHIHTCIHTYIQERYKVKLTELYDKWKAAVGQNSNDQNNYTTDDLSDYVQDRDSFSERDARSAHTQQSIVHTHDRHAIPVYEHHAGRSGLYAPENVHGHMHEDASGDHSWHRHENSGSSSSNSKMVHHPDAAAAAAAGGGLLPRMTTARAAAATATG